MTRVLTLQVIEANLNRLREGIRTAEEALRYTEQTQKQFRALKKLREYAGSRENRLRESLGAELASARLLERDSGREGAGELEVRRDDLLSLLAANFKRAQEAARNLEEYCKLLGERTASADFKRIRFQLYAHERAARLMLEARQQRERARSRVTGALARFPLYLILDDANTQRQSLEQLTRAFYRAGGRILQIRFKHAPARKLVMLAKKLKRDHPRLIVIINDRADIAVAADADGVHLGEYDLTIPDLGETRGRLIIGRSVRTLAAIQREVKAGADYLGIGAVFASPTKPQARVVGLERLSQLAQATDIPCVAIGGITAANFRKVLRARVDGFCAISAFAEPSEAKRFFAAIREYAAKRGRSL